MPIGWGEEYEISDGINKITIPNDGSAYARPVIKFTGNFDSVSVTLGENTISYSVPFANIEIDCECFAVFEGENEVTDRSTGDFIELSPGDNEVIIAAIGSGTVCFDFNPKYFYDTQY